MVRYCPNCKRLIDGETAVCPHCLQSLPRLVPVQIIRSHTTIPFRSTWEKLRKEWFFKPKGLGAFYLLSLLAMITMLLSGERRLVIGGLILGAFALFLMALSIIDVKRRNKQPARPLNGPKFDQANEWLEALAKKDRKR